MAVATKNRSTLVTQRAKNLSFFRKGDAFYVYHDLWGYIMGMDEWVLKFLLAIGTEPTHLEPIYKQFEDRFRREQAEAFVATFEAHSCLISPHTSEIDTAFATGYPLRAAWTVAYAESDECVVLSYKNRETGDVVLETLTGACAYAWTLIDGLSRAETILEKVAERFDDGASSMEVLDLLTRLSHSRHQVLKLIARPLDSYLNMTPPYVRSTMPHPRLAGHQLDPLEALGPAAKVVNLAGYHQQTIAEADEQFEVTETTLSHMLRDPHPALAGKSYAGALVGALKSRSLLPTSGRIVELGGGTGWFARRALEALAEGERRDQLSYTIADIAPALQASQRRQTAAFSDVSYVRLNGSDQLPFADNAVDLFLCNEVVADLETVQLCRDELEADRLEHPAQRAALDLIERHGLPTDDAPHVFWLNAGALKLVEEVARILKPGGAAVLTEFGHGDRYPVESTHLDHSEFSIHFGHMEHVARSLGLSAELVPVPELIGLQGKLPVLTATRTHFECLRALAASRGIELKKIAYTREQLMNLVAGRLDLEKLSELRFTPCGQRALGLCPDEFLALIIRKPEADVGVGA